MSAYSYGPYIRSAIAPYGESTHMLNAEVDEAEVEEGARQDPPPLAVGDGEGVDEVLLAERPDLPLSIPPPSVAPSERSASIAKSAAQMPMIA